MAKKFYITTTAPYVNAEPHIGFALEIVQADALARYHQLLGEDVFSNTGTDEHGVKIYRKALEANQNPQEYVNEYAAKFGRLKKVLNLNYNHSIRTTDPKHIEAAQELWRRSFKNGDIYKKFYKIKYCSGCELEKTDSELVQDHCPLHPNLEIDNIEEENYFFRFSKYQQPLLDFYQKHPDFVIPRYRFNEIIEFVNNGLEDFSVSRLKTKMPWGIDVPNDPAHVMYVWFDALIFYISSIGWPKATDFDGYWPGVQVAGKDNLRQQAAIWQAMLLSAGLPNSKQILIHGFIQSGGQKMSKSLGNVVDPIFLSQKYGTDALRYYLLAKVHPFNDSDFTLPLFEETYNADLANGLGNLVSRVAKMAEKDGLTGIKNYPKKLTITGSLDKYEFHLALIKLWEEIRALDLSISRFAPWEKTAAARKDELINYVTKILSLAWQLQIFLPETAAKIAKTLTGSKIKLVKPLFPRL